MDVARMPGCVCKEETNPSRARPPPIKFPQLAPTPPPSRVSEAGVRVSCRGKLLATQDWKLLSCRGGAGAWGPCAGQPRAGRDTDGGAGAAGRREEDGGSRAGPTGSKLPACGEGRGGEAAGEMVQLICGASPARRLLSEGGCIQRGRTLGAGRAFIKSLIINCSRAWHSTWEDKTQPRDQPARPGAVHAVRRGPGARTHPARAARAKLSRPPRSPAPRTQLSGAPRPQTGRGVVGSRGRLLFPGWGAGASGTRMLAEPAVSGAPTGPGPGRGEVGRGWKVAPVDSPFLPGTSP